MSNKRKQQIAHPGGTKAETPPSVITLRLAGKKLWLFRATTLVLMPIVFVGLLEAVLRVAGFGQATSFLLPLTHHGQELYVPNNQFGWRFFGPQLSRLPEAFAITRAKPPGTVRILVLGESAAKGEPQPAFGMPRLLQAMLSLRYPEARFEVVNGAMTAINSHVILPIARDCADAGADIWVIYMGNNEVVGPFGAGTVFGQQHLPLSLIRATLTMRATRTGQLLGSAGTTSSAGPDEWRGMKMFLDQQVRAEDRRMAGVYERFQQNLADIIRTGQQGGAGIVVSTVAVNLRDCAPFSSLHRSDLAATDLKKWEQLYSLGIAAQTNGNFALAAGHFAEAARLDDSFAELRFRQGECALALNQSVEARGHFQAARDADTLRFRCDARLNQLIRQAGTNRESERIYFADAERAFSEASPGGLPGATLFYEHVHPTFEGNYLLARTLAEQVEKLLPGDLSASTPKSPGWPSLEDCARRLAWTDWTRQAALQDILARQKEPPFTAQVNHETQLQSLTARLEELTRVLQPDGLAQARSALEVALAAAPDDPVLLGLLTSLKQSAGDFEGAAELAKQWVALLPAHGKAWQQYGLILVRQQKIAEAVQLFRRATDLDPMDMLHRQNLAQSLWLLGRRGDAISQYRRAVKLHPNFAIGWLGLGQALDGTGRAAEAAECYQKALTCRTSRATDLTTLARFCRSRDWHAGALTNYNEAIKVNPGDAKLRLEAGEFLVTQGQYADARQCFEEAVRLAPELVPARQLYGSMLGQTGNAADAEREFREVLRLAPDHLEAKLNLGISLMTQGKNAEALTNFHEVLRRSPTNEMARKLVERLGNTVQ